jgi:hypothetical protein
MCLEISLNKNNDDAAEGAMPVKLTQIEGRDGAASVLATLRLGRFKSV